jgi:hypothetical protein
MFIDVSEEQATFALRIGERCLHPLARWVPTSSSVANMVAVPFAETSVKIYQSARCHMPKDSIVYPSTVYCCYLNACSILASNSGGPDGLTRFLIPAETEFSLGHDIHCFPSTGPSFSEI